MSCEDIIPHCIGPAPHPRSSFFLQLSRDGSHTFGQLGSARKEALDREYILPFVTSALPQIEVEGTFPTGTHLVTVHQPRDSDDGAIKKAVYDGSLPPPTKDRFPLPLNSQYESGDIYGVAGVPTEDSRKTFGGQRRRH